MTRGSSAPSPNGHRNHGLGSTPITSTMRRSALATSTRTPASDSNVSGACQWEWLPTRWPSARIRRAREGCAVAHRPWTKNVARMSAAARASRMASPVPGAFPSRLGCSASKVRATRNSLTPRRLHPRAETRERFRDLETSLTIPSAGGLYPRIPPGGKGRAFVGVKVAVVGAGSTYTPELVEGFATHRDRLPVDELALMDVDPERLQTVGGVAGRILDAQGWDGRMALTQDRDQALDGASFVVVQIRVGGQAARLTDESIPPRFGCIGQETTGPGGFAKALRTVPVVLELAEEVAARGTAGAWMVDFTNPVGIVTQALLDEGHRAVGLCNVAIGLQRRLAGMLGAHWEEIELEHVGLNHLSWERAVHLGGRDVLPHLLDRFGEELAEELELPVQLLR